MEAISDAEHSRPRLQRERTLFVLAAIGASALSALFSVVVADRLQPAAANDVRSVLAALSAIGFLILGLQLAIVSWLSGHRRGAGPVSVRLSVQSAVAALVFGVASGLAAAVVVESTNAYRVQVGAQVAIAVAAMAIAMLPRAELLEQESWPRLGALLVIDPALRVGLGLLLLTDERSAANLLPITIAQVAVAVAAFALHSPKRASRLSIPLRQLSRAAAASGGLLAMIVCASVAPRARLGEAADLYNQSAVITRVIVFAPLTVTVLFFPALARFDLGSLALRRAFARAGMWTTAIAGIACGALLIAPTRFGRLVVGEDVPLDAEVIRILSVAGFLLAISMVSILLYIAHGSRLALVTWGAAAIMVVGQLLVDTPTSLAVVALVSAAFLFIGVSLPAALRIQPVLHARRARRVGTASRAAGAITLVVPCYNPGPAAVTTITSAAAHLTGIGLDTTIIAVSDGSTDGSPELLDALDIPGFRHVRHEVNKGKGAALKTGFALAETELVAFIDADGDLDPALLESLVQAERDFSADIVFGSKLHPDSEVAASRLRRLYSAGYQALIRLLFQLDVHDTQTGIKLLRHDVVHAVLPTLREDGFALDLEIFIAARAAGFTEFVEVPVVLRRSAGSTISIRAVRRMFTDTLRLFWRAKIALVYLRSTHVDATIATEALS